MDFKREAVQKLRDYEKRKAAITSSAAELERIAAEMTALKSSLNAANGHSNAVASDDRIINLIAMTAEMKTAARINKAWVKSIERGLASLSKEQRYILDLMYIRPRKGAADEIGAKLHIEIATVYRRRNEALRAFTLGLYGVMEI